MRPRTLSSTEPLPRRSGRFLALVTSAGGALLAPSCLLPEVELSDEPAQGQGNLVGEGGNTSGAGGGAAGGAPSSGAGGGPSSGTGGTGAAGDVPPPTDLTPGDSMPGGSGGSASAPLTPEVACDNGALDGSESDVDCGGACAPCEDGAACVANADCAAGRCVDGLCAPAPSCQDGVQNQDETGVDCGGSACSARCAANQACRVDGDCGSGLSCGAGVCATPSCNDQRQNGSESAIDCGGSCPQCAPGATCASAADCSSLSCTAGVCAAPSCSDRIQNQGETAVDCGGPCGLCAPGQACTSAAQCTTNICAAAGCPAGVARCCQPDPCPGPVVCDPGERRCSDDDDSLEQCNECQDGFEVVEECTLTCIAIAGNFVCDLPGLPSLPL